MSRRKKDPLRPLTPHEQQTLLQVSRSQTLPAVQAQRAQLLLRVTEGADYQDAASAVGRRSLTAVSNLVARFNQEGLPALTPRHGGGPPSIYTDAQRKRILQEAARTPTPEQDGCAVWSLSTLQNALRIAPDGLPTVSTFTLWHVLKADGQSHQQNRTWCETGTVQRKRKDGFVTVTDPDTDAKKKLIENAYTLGEAMGLPVWRCDQAGPFQTIPQEGQSWQPEGKAARTPHEYFRNGTAKILTLFHPADGEVRVEGTISCTNAVLHGWLQRELSAILQTLPVSQKPSFVSPTVWEIWQAGLTEQPPLPQPLPPLRMLLVLDNLAGHKTPELVNWLLTHGIMPLYTPLGGSWLNLAESIQRILKRRALNGQHPTSPEQIMGWFEAVAAQWNRAPTPFVWGGKRQARRARQRERRYRLGGSGGYTRTPIRRRSKLCYLHEQVK